MPRLIANVLGGAEVQASGALAAHRRVAWRYAVIKQLAVVRVRHQSVVLYNISARHLRHRVVDATLWNIIRTLLSCPVTKYNHYLRNLRYATRVLYKPAILIPPF